MIINKVGVQMTTTNQVYIILCLSGNIQATTTHTMFILLPKQNDTSTILILPATVASAIPNGWLVTVARMQCSIKSKSIDQHQKSSIPPHHLLQQWTHGDETNRRPKMFQFGLVSSQRHCQYYRTVRDCVEALDYYGYQCRHHYICPQRRRHHATF